MQVRCVSLLLCFLYLRVNTSIHSHTQGCDCEFLSLEVFTQCAYFLIIVVFQICGICNLELAENVELS